MKDVKNNPLAPAIQPSVSSPSSKSDDNLQILPSGRKAPLDLEAFVQKVNATVATPAGTWEHLTPQIMRSTNLHLLASTQAEEPVGYAALEGRHLAYLALLPHYRRRGLGGHAIEALLHKNGGALSLHVRACNAAARRFYDGLPSARISVTSQADGRYDNGDDRVRYSLSLRPDKQLS